MRYLGLDQQSWLVGDVCPSAVLLVNRRKLARVWFMWRAVLFGFASVSLGVGDLFDAEGVNDLFFGCLKGSFKGHF